MGHPSDCPYRKQAKKVLVTWSVMSFTTGAAASIAACAFLRVLPGNLEGERQSLSCPITLLAS